MSWHELQHQPNWYSGAKSESTKEYTARINYEKLICKSVKSFKQIVDCKIDEGIQYRIVTNNSFNALTVLKAISEIEKVNKLYISSFRINAKAIIFLKEIIINQKIESNILTSSFLGETKKHEAAIDLLRKLKEETNLVKIGFAWLHTKVFLIKTESGKHIVFEGSGNMSNNAKIEQYIYENNQQVFEFHANWITETINNSK
ncbi:MAG: hypothetical protein A2W90_02515 [Bacteroidetes bacterium GWF2_42_66]|nr:MAG: hypothetical protein A2W92_16195 [Bacteroidetes bacterium GWA2_42_15]OFY01224.1 MAG: hypothetical protein A2W89_16000 [Bacteroidetes bacterium GWE2_42_39]OFY42067.1 MAG: hypothetical protein A2W90_02515 [Bacteroidetes bacterium GWF2_42_66]HBL77730.1 hypothetical protein [Prolixibacteraceae bacterium]HCB62859.1 hypothetical protein [Bacteroidales bacterium]